MDIKKVTEREKDIELIEASITKIPDFPKKGVLFYDIFSILKDAILSQKLLDICCEIITMNCRIPDDISVVVGLESRGFLLGMVIADRLKLPFVPARKKNKLPGEVYKVSYSTEYSQDSMELQVGSIQKSSKVLIVDDLLATGGSMKSAEDLIFQADCQVAAYFVVFAIDSLNGKNKLSFPDKLLSMIKI
jgi:adenine phosphoribosyltransferase